MTEYTQQRFRKIGILCNPKAGRVKNKTGEIRAQSESLPGVAYREARVPEEFAIVIKEFVALEIDLFVIIAGDGTIHAVLTQIFNAHLFQTTPVLSFVPAGTTNMTALDSKMNGKPELVLARLIQQLKEGSQPQIKTQKLVKVQCGKTESQYGFFLGIGVIAEAVAYFQNNIKKTGLTGEGASAIVFIRFLLILVFNRRQINQSIIELHSDDFQFNQGPCLVLLISSLHRLLFGMRPYWGSETGALHMTLVSEPPRRLWRSLFALLNGKGHQLSEEDGYSSHNVNKVSIKMKGKYVIDGEIYSVSPDAMGIEVSADTSVSILQPEELLRA